MKANHVALVNEGRAGHECKIMDQKEKTVEELKALLTKLTEMVGELLKMEQAEAEARKAAPAPDTEEMDARLKEKDEQIAGLQKECDEMKNGMPAAVEKAAEDRASIVHDAQILLPTIDVKGKTNRQIMVEILQAKHQDCAEMIDAVLGGKDMAHDSTGEDTIRSAFRAVCTTSDKCGFGKAAAAAEPPKAKAGDAKPRSYGEQLWDAHHK